MKISIVYILLQFITLFLVPNKIEKKVARIKCLFLLLHCYIWCFVVFEMAVEQTIYRIKCIMIMVNVEHLADVFR